MTKSICAVIVTHNRKELLRECLEALLNQTLIINKIIVVNNASIDGTTEMLKKYKQEYSQIETINLTKNVGGAGGFFEGIKFAVENGYDWIWIMDDDVIPQKNALAKLIDAINIVGQDIGFLCSRVVDSEGNSMNVPQIDVRPGNNFYPQWETYLKDGIVKVRSCTFVSMLLPKGIVELLGLPYKEFFIWGDDTEYTLRISNKRNCYLVGSSIVVHKRQIKAPPNILYETDPNRINNHYYMYRNNLFICRKYYGFLRTSFFILKTFYNSILIVITKNNVAKKIMIVLRGILSGFYFNPRIEYPSTMHNKH